jgi:hypothetical protein
MKLIIEEVEFCFSTKQDKWCPYAHSYGGLFYCSRLTKSNATDAKWWCVKDGFREDCPLETVKEGDMLEQA